MTTDTTTDTVTAMLDGVTPGPWFAEASGQADDLNEVVVYKPEFKTIADADGPDASFIAAARTLVPALLAERDALAAEVARLTAALATAKADALREAVEQTDGVFNAATEAGVAVGAYECRRAIIAMIEKDKAND